MCGITALYEPGAPDWLDQVARRMTQLVRHRGPDSEGFAFARPAGEAFELFSVITQESPPGVTGSVTPPAGCTLALGHRRLAILDLSAAGHQPMSDPDGNSWITFNGEIYNHLELRRELVAAGHRFHTASDTEVILAAWREWGERCLERFNGMFAFVLFDRRGGRLFAARDRFGEKPLYFWRSPAGGCAFVSEIKQLTAHPGWQARLHGQAAYDFLNWGLTDHTADTFFAGVRQVRAGEVLLAELDQLATANPRRWYELRPEPFFGSFADAANRFRELLDDSVRLRLRADVPVGTCLSGGLDSSSIACSVRAQLGCAANGRQNTFSAYSDVARFDERRYIIDVVNATGATPHDVTPDPDELLRTLGQVTWHQDEPFGSTSIWAQWCVFRLARQAGVIVMLDGQGADEVLGGYQSYFGPHLAGLLAHGRLVRFARECAAFRAVQNLPYGLQLRLLANDLVPAGLADRLRRLTGRTVKEPAFIDLGKLGALARSPHAGSTNLRTPVRALSLSQLTSLNLPQLLHYADRDAMAHGVESRLPFLDHRLVEFCLGVPEDFKLGDGWTKRFLREGMRHRLPESVRLRRDKLGFATAEEVWMRDRHRTAFIQLLDEALDGARGILTEDARRKAHRILDGQESFSFLVWRMINFGQWLRCFNVGLGL